MTKRDENARLNTAITVLAENVRTGMEEVARTLANRVASLLHPFYDRMNAQDAFIKELTDQVQDLTNRIEKLEQGRE